MRRRSREQRKAETRQALLRSARQLLWERGPKGASIRAITERAGLSLATFYLHFQSKDDVLCAIAEELEAVLNGLLREWLATALCSDWRNQAMQGLTQFIRTARENHTLFLLVHRDWSDIPVVVRRRLEQGQQSFIVMLAQYLQRAVENGLVGAGYHARLAAEAMVGSFIRLVRLHLELPDDHLKRLLWRASWT